MPVDGIVTIKVFDISGKEVAEPLNEFQAAGYYTKQFNGSNLSSGIYLYSLKINDFTSTKKMLIVK